MSTTGLPRSHYGTPVDIFDHRNRESLPGGGRRFLPMAHGRSGPEEDPKRARPPTTVFYRLSSGNSTRMSLSFIPVSPSQQRRFLRQNFYAKSENFGPHRSTECGPDGADMVEVGVSERAWRSGAASEGGETFEDPHLPVLTPFGRRGDHRESIFTSLTITS